jgi:hypothetical protein
MLRKACGVTGNAAEYVCPPMYTFEEESMAMVG